MSTAKRLIVYFFALIGSLLLLIYTTDYTWVKDGLMVITSMLLVAKSKLITFLLLSKTKILLFLTSLTTVKVISLAVKRFILDNIVSKWINAHIMQPIMEPVRESFRYFRQISWRRKMGNLLLFIMPVTVVAWLGSFGDTFANFFFIAEIKALVIGFFKLLWYVLYKIIYLFTYFFNNILANSFLAPVFEIFALSFLLSLIERLPLIGKPLRRIFEYIGDRITALFFRFDNLQDRYVTPHLQKYVGNNVSSVSQKWSDSIKRSKVKNEKALIEAFVGRVGEGTIHDYYTHKKIRALNKQEAIALINEKTGDNIDIVASFCVDVFGQILEDGSRDTLENDVFLIESLASHAEFGIVDADAAHEISCHDFWAYNSSAFEFCLRHREGHFPETRLPPKSVTLVKAGSAMNYTDKSITLHKCPTPAP